MPEPRSFETVSAMLAETRPDLLMVGSPNLYHLEHVAAGLRAGVRVFTEKPVVIDEEQTMKMAALLAEYGSESVLVGLVLRYSDLYRDLRAAQAEGHIGAITSIEASEHIALITVHSSCATGAVTRAMPGLSCWKSAVTISIFTAAWWDNALRQSQALGAANPSFRKQAGTPLNVSSAGILQEAERLAGRRGCLRERW